MLPPGRHGRVGRQDHRQWLSRGRIQAAVSAQESFAGVLGAIGHAIPREGLAALRFWGQTSGRSGAWIAAADPVHLEARLDHLCLYALRGEEIDQTDLRDLYDYLQKTLGDSQRYDFARLGRLGYLRGHEPIATATVSPAVVDGRAPDEYMPAGDDAAAHDRLLSEMQMALHDHVVNQQRAASGKRSVNSMWIWGGGIAPEKGVRPIPPLFAEDPLFKGYWDSCTGVIETWRNYFDQCLSIAPDGFVAVAPDELDYSPPEVLADHLEQIRVILKRGDLRTVTLLFRDALKIEIRKNDAYRFWRKVSPILMEPADNE